MGFQEWGKEALNKNCLPRKIVQLPQFPILSRGRQGDGTISDTTKWWLMQMFMVAGQHTLKTCQTAHAEKTTMYGIFCSTLLLS